MNACLMLLVCLVGQLSSIAVASSRCINGHNTSIPSCLPFPLLLHSPIPYHCTYIRMWYMAHILYILIYMSPLTTVPFLFLSSLPPLFFPNQMLSLNHLSARWTEGATMRPILGMSMDVRRTFLSGPRSHRKSIVVV